MTSDNVGSPKFNVSSAIEQSSPESPINDDSFENTPARPGLPTDFSYLSANFSSESLHADIDGPSSNPYAPSYGNALSNTNSVSLANNTPLSSSNGNIPGTGNFPYQSKRYSFNGSNTSLGNSPAAPIRQQSHGYHQRTGSNSNTSRPRPRSFFGPESGNNPIWEYATESADTPELEANFSANINYGLSSVNAQLQNELSKPGNRNSGHFSSRRNSFTPSVNLEAPSESRTPRFRSGSPSRGNSPVRQPNASPYRSRASSPVKSHAKMQPFNFKPQDLSVPGASSNTHAAGGSISSIGKPAHRKGHRYKHSSVSMNLFQEPIPIADANLQPNLIPDSYPIPNMRESFGSANHSQKYKLSLSLVHALTAVIVFVAGVYTQQPVFSTLAHLIFYDSLGSLMASCVDVMSNFEVWGKSSIAYPFGLGRLEILSSFALSTSSVMVGVDLVSHFVEEMVVGLVDPSIGETTEHGAHHIHGSKETTPSGWVVYELILVLVIVITWITSTYIFDQPPLLELLNTDSSKKKPANSKESGILDSSSSSSASKKMAVTERVKSVSKILVNHPIRLLTLLYSAFLSVAPLIPERLKEQSGFDINESSILVVASLLCYAGWNLVKTLGGILLISFPYSDYDFTVTKASILDRVINSASFKTSYSIEKLHFTKASPRLYLAGVSVHMKGASSDDESRLVFEINRIIVDTLKSLESECQVETTISADRV